MPLESKYALRVSSIPINTTRSEYANYVRSLLAESHEKKSITSFLKKLSMKKTPVLSTEFFQPQSSSHTEDNAPLVLFDEPLHISLAKQHDSLVGTISTSSKKALTSVVNQNEKSKKCHGKGWDLSNDFQGITVLHEYKNRDEVEMDICSVHGLGGNAMDTWTAKGGIMWLRDFLPSSEYFEKSRIMTFGYDSDMTDRENVMTLDNWAETLLHRLDEVRVSKQERERPLILVCHSLGGLVARKAMSQLPTSNVRGITLSNCGLVFLATPHTGTTRADWNNFMVAAVEVTSGLRQDILDHLRSFNPESVWDKKMFLKLNPRPPFKCFAEGRRQKIKGTLQHVVTQGSASLDPENPAHMIMQADHNSICKFDVKLGAFVTISGALRQVYVEVTGKLDQEQVNEHRTFGHPRFVAHAYPPYKKAWWEGSGLGEIQYRLSTDQPFIGRSDEMSNLETSVAESPSRQRLTTVKGIAGIGKTELLIRFAVKLKHKRNVFFLRGSQPGSLEDSLAHVCNSIGFDLIENPNINSELWQRTPTPERIQIFVSWLGQECNRDSLLVLDDAEVFGAASIQTALKFPAWHIVMSTRNSTLEGRGREVRDIQLQPLDENCTISLLQNWCRSLEQDETSIIADEDFKSLARIVAGHPLATQNVIPFLFRYLGTCSNPAEEFVRIFTTGTLAERRVFFDFAPNGMSLWSAFNSSLEKLRQQQDSEKAVKLFQLLPYLRTDHECMDSFLKISGKRGSLPSVHDHDIPVLQSAYLVVSQWLENLQGVSFYIANRGRRTCSLNIHPLILEFAQLTSQGLQRDCIKEVLQVLFDTHKAHRNEDHQSIVLHVNHCLNRCSQIGVSLQTLGLSPQVVIWLETISSSTLQTKVLSRVHTPTIEIPLMVGEPRTYKTDEFVNLCAEAQEKWKGSASQLAPGQVEPLLIKCVVAFKELKGTMQKSGELKDYMPLVSLSQAIGDLSTMAKSISLYPDLWLELEDFQNYCNVLKSKAQV